MIQIQTVRQNCKMTTAGLNERIAELRGQLTDALLGDGKVEHLVPTIAPAAAVFNSPAMDELIRAERALALLESIA